MKVLYLGVWKDGTGWGQAAVDYILAMDAAGIDVVPRAIKLNNHKPELPARLLELEKKSLRGCDVVIQHVLPHQYDFNGHMKNIGLFASETKSLVSSTWTERLAMMDEVWCINHEQAASFRHRPGQKVSVVPHTADMTKYQAEYEPLTIPGTEDTFIFYFIGEMNTRKNLSALLKAFHLEFGVNEPVSLVIKTGIPGVSDDDSEKQIRGFSDEIKRGLKLYASADKYKQEIFVIGSLPESEIYRLHRAADCFVCPSHGEAWCIPAFDAMGFGKTPIVTNTGGFRDYVDEETGWLVDATVEPCFGMMDTFRDLGTGREEWATVDINHLRQCMRQAYDLPTLRQAKSDGGVDRAFNFSYEAVGQQIKRLLHD